MKPQLVLSVLWLAFLLFPPLLAMSLNFKGDVSCSQGKLSFHHYRLAGVFHCWHSVSTSEPWLPLLLVAKNSSRNVVMLSRLAVILSPEEKVIRKSVLGLCMCSDGIQEKINKCSSLNVAIGEFYPEVVRLPLAAVMVLMRILLIHRIKCFL